MTSCGFRILVILCTLLITQPSFAKPLLVGVIKAPPLSFLNESKQWKGSVVDLWKEIADKNQWEYEFIDLGESVMHGITLLPEKKIDLLIGPITVAPHYMDYAEFSQPLYLNRIGVAEIKQTSFLKNLYHFFSGVFIGTIGIIFLLCCIFSIILWGTEKKHQNKEVKKETWLRGTAYMYWTTLITLFSNNPVFNPRSISARVILLLLVIMSSCFSGLIISTFTSVLTVSIVQSQGLPTLGHRSPTAEVLAGVQGRYGLMLAEQAGHKVIKTANLDEAFILLEQKTVDGVIGNVILLKSELKKPQFSNLQLSPHTLAITKFAIATPIGSPIFYKINHTLLNLQQENVPYEICKRYMTAQDALACAI